MKKGIFLLLLFCSLQSLTLRAQGDAYPGIPDLLITPVESLQDQVVLDSLMRWEERVYLHTDRETALAGEAVFFKAYVYNSPTQKRFSPSGVLRLELRDAANALVTTQYHPLTAGTGEGVLRLPEKLQDGTYELVAHTRWMQNYGEDQFFRKTIRIGEGSLESEPGAEASALNITFHPEGGRLLAGIQNRLVIRTTGANAEGLVGEILDQEGNVLVPVQPYARGVGMAIFTPEPGEEYTFRNAEGARLKLPEIGVRGYSLKVNTLASEKISLEVQPTAGMGGDPVILKGERDGQTYFIHMMEFNDDGIASLEVPKAGLPAGFVNFTLTGLDEVVWARRPVWIAPEGTLNVEAKPLHSKSSKNEEMAFRIRVTDSEGKPVETDLSIAVTQASQLPGTGIDTYLNPVALNEDVPNDRRVRFIEDLKVQSTGHEGRDRNYPNEIRYPVEQGLELHGTAYDLENNLLTNSEIQMVASSDTELVIREMKTDAAGVLHVSDLNVIGDTPIVFRTKGEEMAQRLVKIRPILEEDSKSEAAEVEVPKSKIFEKSQKKNPVVESTPIVPFDTTGVIVLDEATVEKRREQQKVVPSLYNLQPNKKDVVYQDPERPLPIEILAQQLPGVQYRLNANLLPMLYHMRRGGGGIVYVVDGLVLRQDPELSPFTFLSPGDILRMEFYLDTADTAVFTGIFSPNTGFLVIYTRSGSLLDYVNRKEGGLVFKGFEPATQFDTWMAERQSNRKLRKAEPQTLYWNPSVQTDRKGEAIIRFKSPTDIQELGISIETLTPDGKVAAFRERF